MKYLFILALLTCLNGFGNDSPLVRKGYDFDAIASLAVQDRGRFKPLETYANEAVLFVTGKRTWKGMGSVEVFLGWLIAYDREWENEPFIRIDYGPLKRELGLSESEKYFSPTAIEKSTKLVTLMREVVQKEQRKERLTELEKKAVQLQNQRGWLEAVVSGQGLTILPNREGLAKPWHSLGALTQNSEVPYDDATMRKLAEKVKGLLDGFMADDVGIWNKNSATFVSFIKNELGNGLYPDEKKIERERQYNRVRPFQSAWILYFVAFILLLTFHGSHLVWAKIAGWISLGLGFLVHSYGFGLRMIVSGRPPVTNMYESVIWVSWGCLLFAAFIYFSYRNEVILTAASVFSFVSLILADNVPYVLDPSIQPLEPVLRSNFWLTIHVLTITLSYAAFAVSLCLGNVVLGNYIWRPDAVTIIQQFSLFMYRAMQIGVVLLAAGTILGGVWADYSWGRFWGWDPKEVWALVALLLYLAVLHGRFTGWLKGFGFVTTTVFSFLGVLMAWYGVNFVLGVGLHSYGFGSGGMTYVATYVMAQLLFVLVAYLRYSKVREAAGGPEPAIFPK